MRAIWTVVCTNKGHFARKWPSQSIYKLRLVLTRSPVPSLCRHKLVGFPAVPE